MEMYLNLLLLLPATLGLQSSHVQVTIGGSSYSHGSKHDLPHPPPAYTPLPKPPPPPPVYTPQPHPTPAPYVPHVQHPAHVSVLPIAPVHHPVVHHAPVHHTPLYTAHPAPYTHDRYAPQQNCTVTEDMVTAEVCVPTLKSMCTQESLMIKRIVDKEQCQDVTRTVCTESSVEVPSTVCTYMYKTEEMMATAQLVEVSFEKMCTTQMVTVCEPGYGYNAHCKEVHQETCYNKPMVMPMEEKVTVSYPVPVMDCMDKIISLPTVSCQDIMEKRCIMIPGVMDDEIMVEKCGVEIGEPSCTPVKLTLPTQTCTDIVYRAPYQTA